MIIMNCTYIYVANNTTISTNMTIVFKINSNTK